MGRQKSATIEYSAPWFRPIKTAMGEPGWFVDKRISLWKNKISIETRVVSIPFPDLAAAEKFLRCHRDVIRGEVKDADNNN